MPQKNVVCSLPRWCARKAFAHPTKLRYSANKRRKPGLKLLYKIFSTRDSTNSTATTSTVEVNGKCNLNRLI
jgi:hypothetical protein